MIQKRPLFILAGSRCEVIFIMFSRHRVYCRCCTLLLHHHNSTYNYHNSIVAGLYLHNHHIGHTCSTPSIWRTHCINDVGRWNHYIVCRDRQRCCCNWCTHKIVWSSSCCMLLLCAHVCIRHTYRKNHNCAPRKHYRRIVNNFSGSIHRTLYSNIQFLFCNLYNACSNFRHYRMVYHTFGMMRICNN